MGFGNKKLVIYSAANAHGYITCIVHRLVYNPDSYAVYIGDDVVAPRTGGIDFFDDSNCSFSKSVFFMFFCLLF